MEGWQSGRPLGRVAEALQGAGLSFQALALTFHGPGALLVSQDPELVEGMRVGTDGSDRVGLGVPAGDGCDRAG